MVQPGRESWKYSGTSTPHMCHCRHRLAPCRCMAAAQPHIARPHASLCAVEHGKAPARAQELVCGDGTEGPGKGVGPVGPDPPPRDRGAHDAVAGEEDEDEQDDTCRQDVWVGRHGHGCLLDFCHQRPVILQPSRFPALTATAAGQGRAGGSSPQHLAPERPPATWSVGVSAARIMNIAPNTSPDSSSRALYMKKAPAE